MPIAAAARPSYDKRFASSIVPCTCRLAVQPGRDRLVVVLGLEQALLRGRPEALPYHRAAPARGTSRTARWHCMRQYGIKHDGLQMTFGTFVIHLLLSGAHPQLLQQHAIVTYGAVMQGNVTCGGTRVRACPRKRACLPSALRLRRPPGRDVFRVARLRQARPPAID